MKAVDYRITLSNVPQFAPVFRITRTITWLEERHGYKKGDMFLWSRDAFTPINGPRDQSFILPPSSLAFVEYRQVDGMPIEMLGVLI